MPHRSWRLRLPVSLIHLFHGLPCLCRLRLSSLFVLFMQKGTSSSGTKVSSFKGPKGICNIELAEYMYFCRKEAIRLEIITQFEIDMYFLVNSFALQFQVLNQYFFTIKKIIIPHIFSSSISYWFSCAFGNPFSPCHSLFLLFNSYTKYLL